LGKMENIARAYLDVEVLRDREEKETRTMRRREIGLFAAFLSLLRTRKDLQALLPNACFYSVPYEEPSIIMANFEEFMRQSDFLASLPYESNLSPATCYLLGACHAQTGLTTSALLPFLEELESSCKTGWLTPVERRKVEYQVYLGALGSARELLSAYQEGKTGTGEGGVECSRACDLCGEDSLMESGWKATEQCGHFTHTKCAQTAVRPLMLKGGHKSLHCPVANCTAGLADAQLQLLFTPEDYQILHEYWVRSQEPATVVLCPNFHCKTSTLWQASQYFSCLQCHHTYCLHCLALVDSGSSFHICAAHSEESLAVGAEFSHGGRFKACEACGYWCSLKEGRVTCCCGIEFCGKCVLKSAKCTCEQSLVDKLLRLPEELLKLI